MTEDRDSWETRLAVLLRRVRERRLDEAEAELESLIVAAPERAAHWLVLARLIALDPARWDRQLEAALGQFGAAPVAAHGRAIRILDEARQRAETRSRLEAWAAAWKKKPSAERHETTRIAALEAWRDELRARRAWWRLEAPQRCVARLEALTIGAERLLPPPLRSGGNRRLLVRLETLQGALSP